MGFPASYQHLDQASRDHIEDLLRHFNGRWPIKLHEMWQLLDMVWDELKCDNIHPTAVSLAAYYLHPVWALNGLFVESDAESIGHRTRIANYVASLKARQTLDFGGGFCTLSRMIAKTDCHTRVTIYEPFPGFHTKSITASVPNLQLIGSLNQKYDCVCAIDVLEHLLDPLGSLNHVIKHLAPQGKLILANSFYPVIKCHLPSTFHLRYTFGLFLKPLGLRFVTGIPGTHASVYTKVSDRGAPWYLVRILEHLSKLIYPALNMHDNLSKR